MQRTRWQRLSWRALPGFAAAGSRAQRGARATGQAPSSTPALGQPVAARAPQRQRSVVRCRRLRRRPRCLLLRPRVRLPGTAAAKPCGAAAGGSQVLVLVPLRAAQREGLLCRSWARGDKLQARVRTKAGMGSGKRARG